MIKRNWVFLIILTFAFILRLFYLSRLPMYGDEMTLVYDSYSLLKTAHDQTGKLLPLTFRMGAGRPAGYVYASVPFVALFGPSALGVRFLSVLSGLGIITVLYLLGKKLFNKNVANLIALLTTISMWDLSLSRGGFEAHFALFLVLLGILAFFYSEKKPWYLVLTIVSFGLTIHTYPIYKLLLPIFSLGLILYAGWFRKAFIRKNAKVVIVSLILGFVFVVTAAAQTFFAGSEERFTTINMFSNKELLKSITKEVDYDRSVTLLPLKYSELINNKPLEYVNVIAQSYLKNFSTEYLFVSGDGNPRHNMTAQGELFWVDFILIVLGALYLWGINKRLFILVGFWLIIAPLPAALLSDTHALRSSFMLPVLLMLSSLGLFYLYLNRKRLSIKFLIIFIAMAMAFQFINALNNLYFLSPNKFARFWSNESKIASYMAYEKRGDYDMVILSDKIDNIEYAYQVYNKIDPKEVISQNIKRKKLDEYDVKQYENVYIVGVPNTRMENFINSLPGKILFLGDYDEEGFLLKDYKKVETGDRIKYLITKEKI